MAQTSETAPNRGRSAGRSDSGTGGYTGAPAVVTGAEARTCPIPRAVAMGANYVGLSFVEARGVVEIATVGTTVRRSWPRSRTLASSLSTQSRRSRRGAIAAATLASKCHTRRAPIQEAARRRALAGVPRSSRPRCRVDDSRPDDRAKASDVDNAVLTGRRDHAQRRNSDGANPVEALKPRCESLRCEIQGGAYLQEIVTSSGDGPEHGHARRVDVGPMKERGDRCYTRRAQGADLSSLRPRVRSCVLADPDSCRDCHSSPVSSPVWPPLETRSVGS